MKKIYTILIGVLAFSSSAYAQSPAQNLMPDGSHDMYLGLGVMSRPIYEGAAQSKRVVIPVMQMQWSNGIFLAGMSAGWHLSNHFNHEFGPLISVEPNRNSSGVSNSIQFPVSLPNSSSMGGEGSLVGDTTAADVVQDRSNNKLSGLDNIRTRLLYGGFYNYQITNTLRQTNTLLSGFGNNQQGIRLSSDLRYLIRDVLPHHQFTLGLGATVVNRAYANSYFGVSRRNSQSQVIFLDFISSDQLRTTSQSPTSQELANNVVNKGFSARAGFKDVHADIFWNWSLNSSWLITSKISVSQIVGSNRDSPLVERKTNFTASSAIAYRF